MTIVMLQFFVVNFTSDDPIFDVPVALPGSAGGDFFPDYYMPPFLVVCSRSKPSFIELNITIHGEKLAHHHLGGNHTLTWRWRTCRTWRRR